MKLEVGQFVRTKRDGIGKIISLSIGEEDECCFIELSKRRTGIKEHNIIGEPSFEIIDLIQEGDYVNGSEVVFKDFNNLNEECLECGIGDYIVCTYYEDDIKSIVTKEQMEAMAYKVAKE